ncbi:MAG: hypothetical protein KJ990_11105 [Proteobacteria bacterium]|nr:hypothetical protein [Pseudomonadota bacterium]MBU1647803.1 hypothetical protein [Pseudomonadota bacterium]
MDTLEIAHAGATCLVNLIQKNGSFKYRYDSQHDTPLNGYNVLRHAGTVWAMLDVYRDIPDKKILECCRQATHYLLDTYLRFFRSYNNACICENNTIKLGGNALSTLALVSLFEITQDHFLLAVAEQLAHFMLDQRMANNRLIHKRYFQSGKISNFHSMYYTGEALFALLALYRLTQQKHWYNTVRKIENKLAPEDYGVKEQSHWMLYFLELLSNHEASSLYYLHAKKIVLHILENPEYLSWERSTPIACRSEGLMAFLRMKRPDNIDDKALCERCLEQIKENLNRQLAFRLPDGSFVRGGQDRRKNEVRIDYIQHNISSYLHFSRFGLTL